MQKFLKPLLLGLAVGLLWVVPATASAGVLYSGASEVPVGTKLSGKSGGSNVSFNSNAIECTGLKFAGSVVRNTASQNENSVESLAFTGVGSENRCTSPSTFGDVGITLNTPACLTDNATLHQWTLRGGECLTTAKILHFTFYFASFGVTCDLRTEGTGITITSNINSEPLILKQASKEVVLVPNEPKTGPTLCQSNKVMSGLSMLLETAAGQGLKVLG